MSEENNKILKISENDALARCELTACGAEFPQDLQFKDWDEVGRVLRTFNNSVQFMIGDWLNYGEAVYGEMFAQAVDESDYSYESMKVMAWVCRKVAPENRNPALSYTHHYQVAKLDPGDQMECLAVAAQDDLSVADLKKHIKEKHGGKRSKVEKDIILGEKEFRDALFEIRNMAQEREMSVFPSKEDIAWMISTLKHIEKKSIEMVGKKQCNQ